MKSYNKELADAFYEIAELMSLLGENGFRVRAYNEAARRLVTDLTDITKKTTKTELLAMPRIGEALADKILQYLKKGKIDYLEKLRKQIPKPVRDILKIPGLGPKRVRQLYINLGIQTKKDLLTAAANGDIQELPGFGERLVEQIIKFLFQLEINAVLL